MSNLTKTISLNSFKKVSLCECIVYDVTDERKAV